MNVLVVWCQDFLLIATFPFLTFEITVGMLNRLLLLLSFLLLEILLGAAGGSTRAALLSSGLGRLRADLDLRLRLNGLRRRCCVRFRRKGPIRTVDRRCGRRRR